jgi:hypothetical protein
VRRQHNRDALRVQLANPLLVQFQSIFSGKGAGTAMLPKVEPDTLLKALFFLSLPHALI